MLAMFGLIKFAGTMFNASIIYLPVVCLVDVKPLLTVSGLDLHFHLVTDRELSSATPPDYETSSLLSV